MKKPICFYDMEVYPTWCCAVFLLDGEHHVFEYTDDVNQDTSDLKWFIKNTILVGFNNQGYDDIQLNALLSNQNATYLYQVSCSIIEQNLRPWAIYKKYRGIKEHRINSIDIMNVCKGQASMKLYGARLNFPRLQELPINPHKEPSEKEQQILIRI